MDAKARIRELMAERKWSEYRLAIASGLSQSTVANIFNRNTTPSIATLESICAGFGITLAQFFAEGNMVELTAEQVLSDPDGVSGVDLERITPHVDRIYVTGSQDRDALEAALEPLMGAVPAGFLVLEAA